MKTNAIIAILLLIVLTAGCTQPQPVQENPATASSTTITEERQEQPQTPPIIETEQILPETEENNTPQNVEQPEIPNTEEPTIPFTLTSSVFTHNGSIPAKYTCEGQELIPPLTISNIPENTQSFALIMTDPDVPYAFVNEVPEGEFVHWIVFNLPSSTTEILEGQQPPGLPGTGFTKEYSSPCPPSDLEPFEHHYIFSLYALDIELTLSEGALKEELVSAMQGHIIQETELIGKYKSNQAP
ncbi:MAG: YbhB/YbcL family Raf kinase inhibitor-like protein [Candidatus Diapherotrites archaeon]|nr:YbhB/YbcL family Raf kinase inhibitor-like protein [Candidatus Diapherotrites archaeon]